MPSTECDTAHSLVRERFKHRVHKKIRIPRGKIPKHHDVNELKRKNFGGHLTE